MKQYSFVWKGTDPEGKPDSTRVLAENAQLARHQLNEAGWTDLELVMEEVCAAGAELLEHGQDTASLPLSTDEEVDYFQGKRSIFLDLWVKSLWDSKIILLVSALFLIWGVWSHHDWAAIVGGTFVVLHLLLFPILHLFYSGNSREYARLNRAKVWGRHEEVLRCVERLRRHRVKLGHGLGEIELARCQAQALAGLGQLETAVATFKRFEGDPRLERWLYLSFLATIYDAAKAYERSLELKKEVVREKPDSGVAWIDLAFSHVRGLNRPADARAALTEAEKREIAGFGKAYLPFLRGVICWREQNFTVACQELETALTALRAFAHFELAEGLTLLSTAHLCAARRALGQTAQADQLLNQVERFLIAHKENELLAACRGQAAT